MIKSKVLRLNSAFKVKDLPKADEKVDSIFIEGYASTTGIDRAGDVVPKSVWEKGIENYLKNPIILAQHDYDDPIGRMVEHKVDDKGLWVKARISAAAETFNLIKDGVLTAFSIGFRILDAEYNAAAEVFLIKEIELVEISVVSIPCNQDTLFSVAKAFEDADEYTKFKEQFVPKGESAKGLESTTETKSTTTKEWNMSPEELQKMLTDAANAAAETATKSLLATQAAEKAAAEKAAAEQAAIDARVKTAVEAQIKLGQSGVEKLMEELKARGEAQEATAKSVLEGLEATVKEKATELAALQISKMQFGDKKPAGDATYQEKEMAVLVSKITGKSIEDTKFGKDLTVKYAGTAQPGTHVATSTWETEVSLNMEAEIRRRLVMAPLLRNINMNTSIMKIPVNPEAGTANWVNPTAFGAAASAGTAVVHALTEITLSAYKVAATEYVAYEEEEDALLVIMPIVRDAMIRRVARSVDVAYLRGAAVTGTDPLKGIASWDATSVVVPTNTGAATVANMLSLRKDLGYWGLDPSGVIYVVSTDIYYDLLGDTTFQTMNQVGQAATLLTGQIGHIGGSPVLVSGEFPSKAGSSSSGTTNIAAICFAPGNFICGNQRGLRFDTQDLVETQRKVLVASLRTGLTQVSTSSGMGVSTLRWS